MRYRRRTDLREDTLQMIGTVSHSSRRAHLLTTSSEQAVYLSLSRLRQSSFTTLFLLSPQSRRLCGVPCGGGVPCGTCALRGLRSGVARLLRR